MKIIKLINGGDCLVDDEDYERLIDHKWYKYSGYAVRNSSCKKKKTVQMHSVIIKKEPWQDIDHIDRNRLNNQKSNLRLCSRSQNNHNSTVRKNNKSTGVKNVTKSRHGNFVVCLWYKGNYHYGGIFKNLSEAADAANALGERVVGEFYLKNDYNK